MVGIGFSFFSGKVHPCAGRGKRQGAGGKGRKRGEACRGEAHRNKNENEFLFMLTMKIYFNINVLSSAVMTFRPVPCGASFVLSEGSPPPLPERGSVLPAERS